ncbi:MAG: M50 family metallopeptidase [Anaerolineae bacterium]
MLSLLIFSHELGHFLAALWMKVRVEEFGFGYPPRMVQLFERKGVKYTLNWLPFGGFVRMAGEERGFDDPGSLTAKKPWQRLIVFSAGPLMNLALAIAIYILLFGSGVQEAIGPVVVQSVAPQSPAAVAGIQEGDTLLSIGGTAVRSFTEVQDATNRHLGDATTVEVDRGGQTLSVVLVPRNRNETPANEGAMGITISLSEIESVVNRPVGIGEAIKLAVQRTFLLMGAMAEGLGQLVLSVFSPSVPAPEGGVAGPIGIAQLTGEVVRSGWQPFLDLTAFLSVNFALLNFLPLPALDGGRLAFALLEWIRRGKRVRPEREALVHLVGMALLILFMLVVSYMDVVRLLQGGSLVPGG